MRKQVFFLTVMLLIYPFAANAGDVDLKSNEKAFRAELAKVIPGDRIVPVAKLHEKWLEVEDGQSKAVLIDIRTRDEFDSGHIMDSNNVDSGHAYLMPDKYSDPDTEIWVYCRTGSRGTYFVSMLYNYGYTNVYMVKGGILAWIDAGYPLVNEYMGQVKVTGYVKRLKEDFEHREGR